jgi:hypothetical protein
VLQAAFGWWDSHLHEFEIDGVRYGTDDGEGWGPPWAAITLSVVQRNADRQAA